MSFLVEVYKEIANRQGGMSKYQQIDKLYDYIMFVPDCAGKQIMLITANIVINISQGKGEV